MLTRVITFLGPARRMPMLATPYILNYAQFDKFELPYNIGA